MTQERQIIGKKISDIESPTVAKEADPALKALEKHIDCYLHKQIKVHLDDNSRCYPVQYRGFCTDKKKPEGGLINDF